jgi:hypothetical protein
MRVGSLRHGDRGECDAVKPVDHRMQRLHRLAEWLPGMQAYGHLASGITPAKHQIVEVHQRPGAAGGRQQQLAGGPAPAHPPQEQRVPP